MRYVLPLLLSAACLRLAAQVPLAMEVHPSSPAAGIPNTTLGVCTLFLNGKVQTLKGQPITLVFLRESMPEVLDQTLKIKAPDYQRFVLQKVNQGSFNEPQFLSSIEEVEAYVSAHPGAVAILRASDARGKKVVVVPVKAN